MRTIQHVYNNEEGKKIIAELRAAAKAHNLMERAKETLNPKYVATFKQVRTFGRLGRNNPNRHKYALANRTTYAVHVKLQDAAKIAVYCDSVMVLMIGDKRFQINVVEA